MSTIGYANTWPSIDIPILAYHTVRADSEPETGYSISLSRFREQMQFLRRYKYNTLAFRDLYAILDSGEKPPRKSAIITFDDGTRCFWDHAYPELLACGIKATVFLVGGEIGGINRWDSIRGAPVRPLLGESQIHEIARNNIELGAHGWSHIPLTNCPPEEVVREVTTVKLELESRFGMPITTFSYPYGCNRIEHHEILRQAGFRGAVCISSTYPTVTFNPYGMRRIIIHSADNLGRFWAKLTPIYLRYLALRDRHNHWHSTPHDVSTPFSEF